MTWQEVRASCWNTGVQGPSQTIFPAINRLDQTCNGNSSDVWMTQWCNDVEVITVVIK